MNDLEKYFKQNDKKLIDKWTHYFDIYDRHFNKYRNKEIVLLEIGVFQGGSLQMWKNYFGGKAKIFGIDVDPRCKQLEEEDIKIFIGSQSDRSFLRQVKEQIPPVDILIDDGGHTMTQQIVTYEELFDYVKDDGIYLCEDLHTSYLLTYGGGYKRHGTFIEYSKNFIDYLNAHHSKQRSLQVNNFTRSVDSVHYYDSLLVIEKRKRDKPSTQRSGKISFASAPKKFTKVNYLFLGAINTILRFFRIKGFIWK
jgi:hypothetical protein